MTATDPWAAFFASVANDPAAPRVTFYERTPGPTQGERIELSGKVLLNWASKAANLLVEEFDVEPGAVVQVTLPSNHWRTVYWLLAAWGAGATVVLGEAKGETQPDVRVGHEGDVDVFVTLAALARKAVDEVPAGTLDEAADLSTFADQFVPMLPLDPQGEALPGVTFEELAVIPAAPRSHLSAPTPEQLLAGVVGGGVVLVRGPVGDDELAPLLQQEGLGA